MIAVKATCILDEPMYELRRIHFKFEALVFEVEYVTSEDKAHWSDDGSGRLISGSWDDYHKHSLKIVRAAQAMTNIEKHNTWLEWYDGPLQLLLQGKIQEEYTDVSKPNH